MRKKKETKLRKFLKVPIKIIAKARDMYIRGMTKCSCHVSHMGHFGFPTACQVSDLPWDLGSNPTQSNRDEDFRELVRAASTRGMAMMMMTENKQIESEYHYYGTHHEPSSSSSSASPLLMKQSSKSKMRRNFSVGMGRIDENKALEGLGDETFQRSNSYGVSRNATISKWHA